MKLIIAYQFHQASFTRYALTTIDITRQANTNKYLPALSTNSVGIIIRGNDVFVKQHGCATVIITNATQHIIHHINTTHCVTVTLTPLLISSHSHVPTQQVEPFALFCPVAFHNRFGRLSVVALLGRFGAFGCEHTQDRGHTGGYGPVQRMDGSCLWRGRYRV
jgi:hypothetical protein